MRYLLAFFFFLMYGGDNLGVNVSFGLGLSTKNLMLYLMLAGIAVNAAVAQNRRIELAPVLVMFSGLILYAFITWVAQAFVLQNPAYDIRAAFISLKSTLVDEFITFLIYFYGLLYLKDTVWLLRAMLWMVMLGNAITIVDTMNVPNLGVLPPPSKGGRFEGFIGQANAYGQFLVLFLPGCIALFLRERGMARLLAGIGALTTLLALILTASRGSYAGCIGGAILAAFYLRRYISTRAVVRAGVAATVVCALALGITFAMGYADLYLERFSGIDANPHLATSGRTSLWSNALESMMENPLSFITGYGFYSYDSSREFRLAPHNMYLNILYNLGIVGVLLFIGIFTRVMAAARATMMAASMELRTHFIAFVVGVFCFLIAIFFSDYHQSGYLLWAYVGLMMRVAMILASSESPETEMAASRSPEPAPAAGRDDPGWAHRNRPPVSS